MKERGRDRVDAHLVNAALESYTENPARTPVITEVLPKNCLLAGENWVQQVCRDYGRWSVFSKERGGNWKPDAPVNDEPGGAWM